MNDVHPTILQAISPWVPPERDVQATDDYFSWRWLAPSVDRGRYFVMSRAKTEVTRFFGGSNYRAAVVDDFGNLVKVPQ